MQTLDNQTGYVTYFPIAVKEYVLLHNNGQFYVALLYAGDCVYALKKLAKKANCIFLGEL